MRWYYVKPHATVGQYYLVIVAVIIAVCSPTRSDDSTGGLSRPRITLYYESLCYDSIQFVRNQLVPTYRAIGSYFTVDYIPYGKATQEKHIRNGVQQWHFTCQHGPQECYGNKAQACGINNILTNPERPNKQQDLINFVGCVMGAMNPSTAVQQCLQTIGIGAHDRSLVDNCISSAAGDELLAAYGNKTFDLQPNLSFVPTIVVNGEYSHANQNNALRNLKGVICNHLSDHNKPSDCRG